MHATIYYTLFSFGWLLYLLRLTALLLQFTSAGTLTFVAAG